jgi:hypothetical protein
MLTSRPDFARALAKESTAQRGYGVDQLDDHTVLVELARRATFPMLQKRDCFRNHSTRCDSERRPLAAHPI